MDKPGENDLQEDDLQQEEIRRLGEALRRPLARLGIERAPMAGLVRIEALHFADGLVFPVPAGNRLHSAGEIAQVRALLLGWPRSLAQQIRARIGPGDPLARRAEVDAALDAMTLDPEATLLAWSDDR